MDKTILGKLIIQELGWRASTLRQDWYSCPYHGVDKTPSLHVDLEKGVWHCFGCGRGGSLTSTFWEEKNQSAYKYFDLEKPETQFKKVGLDNFVDPVALYEDPPDIQLELEGNLIPASKSIEALQYLTNRGLPSSVTDKYNIYYSLEARVIDNLNTFLPKEKRTTVFKDRILIPIKEDENLISVEGRDITNNKALLPKELYHKVLYPKGSSLKTLYNLNNLKPHKRLWLTEGLMDLMALQTCVGFENSTTIFGAGVSDRQLYLLNKFPEIVYIINNDDAGWNSLKVISSKHNGKLYFAVAPNNLNDIGDILNPKKGNSTIKDEMDKGWLKRLGVATKS